MCRAVIVDGVGAAKVSTCERILPTVSPLKGKELPRF